MFADVSTGAATAHSRSPHVTADMPFQSLDGESHRVLHLDMHVLNLSTHLQQIRGLFAVAQV